MKNNTIQPSKKHLTHDIKRGDHAEPQAECIHCSCGVTWSDNSRLISFLLGERKQFKTEIAQAEQRGRDEMLKVVVDAFYELNEHNSLEYYRKIKENYTKLRRDTK